MGFAPDFLGFSIEREKLWGNQPRVRETLPEDDPSAYFFLLIFWPFYLPLFHPRTGAFWVNLAEKSGHLMWNCPSCGRSSWCQIITKRLCGHRSVAEGEGSTWDGGGAAEAARRVTTWGLRTGKRGGGGGQWW